MALGLPDGMNAERANLMKSLGADICLVGRQEDGFLASLRPAEEMAAASVNWLLPRQFLIRSGHLPPLKWHSF